MSSHKPAIAIILACCLSFLLGTLQQPDAPRPLKLDIRKVNRIGPIDRTSTQTSASVRSNEPSLVILLLGDSTTAGSVPRRHRSIGRPLEEMVELLVQRAPEVPSCKVINLGEDGETVRRLLDGGRYDSEVKSIDRVDYVFIRYGLNDYARPEFAETFSSDLTELLQRLRSDRPGAVLIPTTVIPMGSATASEEINNVIKEVARSQNLGICDIFQRYESELVAGRNSLNYRRYPVSEIPPKLLHITERFVVGDYVEVMTCELDPILGHLPNWYSDRHPNNAGYNVIADETAKYIVEQQRRKPQLQLSDMPGPRGRP